MNLADRSPTHRVGRRREGREKEEEEEEGQPIHDGIEVYMHNTGVTGQVGG